MADPASRLLNLLALLQTRRLWSGGELAERLDVDRRTLRRDVDRLRGLGYSVQASSGVGGGYQLDGGAALLPLLFDDEEAVAIAVALRAAAASLRGLDDTVGRVLAKLDPLLPARLRHRASTLMGVMQALPVDGPVPESGVLGRVTNACRDRLILGFAYRNHAGEASQREVEPLSLVNYGRRWYLVAWDRSRDDWRSFRADRIDEPLQCGARFVPRRPQPDPLQLVRRAISLTPFRYQARVRIAGSIAALSVRVPAWSGVLESDGDTHCVLAVGANSIDRLASQLLWPGLELYWLEPDALREPVLAVLDRLRAGIAPQD